MERPGIIKPEIAELYGVPPGTVNDWVRAADWPEPIGKRGRFVEYDRADVVAAVVGRRFHKVPDTVKALGSQPLTQQEIAELFGLDYGTVRVDASRGRLGEPVVKNGVRMFPADQVAAIIAKRRAYRKTQA
ncbi:hypothetical protein GCM10009839_49870 [Catenulispora yoronensis]|uniref:DNA-binding protein n=1 Tax=Catenulispora yoronensis TaxID=450799 RepID=A0ABN2US95_9ACTN